MMILLSSCIEVNHSTPLVDKNRSKHIIIFDSDSTVMDLSGHMKEWNKFWGIINMDDTPKESDDLTLYIQVKNRQPIFIEYFSIKIETIKDGEVSFINDGLISYRANLWIDSLMININDTIKKDYYKNIQYNFSDYLYSIESNDKKLIGCDILIVKPDIQFTVNNNKYHIQRIDTLYRTVEKQTRFIH